MSDANSAVTVPPADAPQSVTTFPMGPRSLAVEEFELMQRQAKLFASSPLVPAHISDGGSQKGLANCYIALVLAKQMNENPLVVMQNIYIVHGRAGWSATYMIAKANASGIFKGVIRFKHEGGAKDRTCTASATLADTGEVVTSTVGMAMAEAEGWTKNAKYRSMPDQMLIYRAATFLVRTYCPQVMLGYRTADEIDDLAASGEIHDTEVKTAASVVDGLRNRLNGTPDAVIETKPAEGELDALDAAIDDFKAAGGVPEELAESNNSTLAKMRAAKGKAREVWASLFATEAELLTAAKGKSGDGALFNNEKSGAAK